MQLVALDTNAYSYLAQGDRKFADVVAHAEEVALPITVVGEIYHGIFNGSKQLENVRRLEEFLRLKRTRVLRIDSMTAQMYGEIMTELKRLGRPMQQNDVWIAALCKQYNFSLLTRDKGFENIIGLRVVD